MNCRAVEACFVVQLLVDVVVVKEGLERGCASLPNGKDRVCLASGLKEALGQSTNYNRRRGPTLTSKLRSAIAALPLTFLLFTFIVLDTRKVAVINHDLVMDKYIDGRFERVEKALANLIDSVTKYHPSIQQGEELNAADQELSRGLKEGNSYDLASHECFS